MHRYEIIICAPQTHRLPRSLILTPFLGTLHKAQSNHVLVMHNSNYGQLPLSHSCSFLPSVRKFPPNKLDSPRMRAKKEAGQRRAFRGKSNGKLYPFFYFNLCRVRSTKCMKGARAARQGSGGGGRSGGDAAGTRQARTATVLKSAPRPGEVPPQREKSTVSLWPRLHFKHSPVAFVSCHH